MVSIQDVLSHIAEDLRHYSGKDKAAAIEEFLTGITFDLHMAITTNVEETELDFMERYGQGHTFYFRLTDYAHGKQLASEMFWVLRGRQADMSQHTGEKFGPGDKLYLFVHVSNISPPLPPRQ